MCVTRGCDKKPKGNRKHCTNCRQRKWRSENPFKYHWKNQKNRAKQRMIPYSLTLEEFKEIWQQHPEKWKDRIENPEKSKWTLDRIDGDKGYHKNNVQVMTQSENTIKSNERRKEQVIEDAPF